MRLCQALDRLLLTLSLLLSVTLPAGTVADQGKKGIKEQRTTGWLLAAVSPLEAGATGDIDVAVVVAVGGWRLRSR